MIVYFDTSALLKRYVAEGDSDSVVALWKEATLVAASQILYAEVAAAIARRRREFPSCAAPWTRRSRGFARTGRESTASRSIVTFFAA